jgi:hypothetical protein
MIICFYFICAGEVGDLVTKTIDLGISLLRGGNTDVQKVRYGGSDDTDDDGDDDDDNDDDDDDDDDYDDNDEADSQ